MTIEREIAHRRSVAGAYARDMVSPISQHIATFGHFWAFKCGRSKAQARQNS